MRIRKVIAALLTAAMVVATLPAGFATERVQAADTWRSALYPENWTPGYTNSSGQFLHDFSYAGYEKGEKEIPTTMSGLYANVLDYGADNTGSADSTSAIQNAINAVEAAGGGTVYLPAGTYKVKPTSSSNASALRIKGSNILFKGDGEGKTFIRCYAENMRYCQVINVSPSSGTWNSADDGNYYYLSQDIPSTPTTTIHLNSVGSLKAGDWVIIRSDRTQSWIDEHSMGGFWYASVNPTTMGTTFYRQIKSVNTANNTIEIDIPTRYYMKTRDNARVYKVTPKQSNVGLMDFSIGNKANSNTSGWGEEDYKTSGNGAYNVNNAFLIKFALNVNCFAKNISSYAAGNSNGYHMSSNGLDISQTRGLTVDNCDFSHPQYEGGGGNGYGMNVCGQETLIKDCSSTSARHSFAFKYSYANGNVVYHYTSTDPKYGSDFHMYLSMSNLIDNEELNGDFVESNVRPYGGTAGNRHGYTSTQTVFWNTKGNYYKSGTNYIIDSRQFGYGYIIGTQGAATNVKTTPTTMSSTYGTVNTAPEDYKEGIGSGATLSPQSLYYDQLNRRLNGSSSSGGSSGSTATTTSLPGTIAVNSCSSKTSSISFTTENGVTYAGGLNNGSYLDYAVNATSAGDYKVTLKLAAGDSQWNAESMLVKVDGNTAATVPVTGSSSWTTFVDHTATINLSAGTHTLSLQSVGGACNVTDIIVEKVASSSSGNSSVAGTTSLPGTIKVDSYSAKTDAITFTTENGVTYAGGLNNGSYLDYSVNATTAGEYKVTLKLAAGDTQWNADSMLVKVDGNTVATVAVIGSSSWTTFIDHTATMNLSAGTHTLSLQAVNGACNVTDIVVEKVSSSNNGSSSGATATGNIASGKTVTASGSEADGTAAKYAVDGDEGTRWSSNFADDAWITVDLGATYAVNKVVLKWEGAYGSAYKILLSTDGNNWTTVSNLTGQDGGTDEISFNATNARYVRMQGVTRALPYGYSLWEMEVYANGSSSSSSSSGTYGVLSKGKAVTSSGAENDVFSADKAVDGDNGTRWSSNFADDAWITVDLGATYSVDKVEISWEGAYGSAYKIQTSTDGSNWTTVNNLTGQDGGNDTVTFNATNARYVRMQGVTRALPYGYSIWEMNVYGK